MTAANMITILRIILIPVFIILKYLGTPSADIAALVVFVIASLTDSLDGYIARKYNQVSNFGKFVDPLADKLLVLAAILVFTGNGVIPAWCTFIILGREFMVSTLRMIASAQGIVIAAATWGKIKTFTQLLCLIILLTGWNFTIIGALTLESVCVYLMVIVAFISGVDYLVANRKILTSEREE